MKKQYPPSGVLFDNLNKRSDKSPDRTGVLEISTDLLQELVTLANNGEPVKMRLIAYNQSHPTKGVYIRLTAAKDEPYNGGKNGRSERAPF